MIRVTVEMVPGGNPDRAYVMHVVEIWNKVSTTVLSSGSRGDYGYRISRKITDDTKKITWQKSGDIEGFPRKSLNVMHLLTRVLQSAYGKEQR